MQPMSRVRPDEIFNRAWDILVIHAGATDDEQVRTEFVVSFMDNTAMEWVLESKLGDGAKFWRRDGKYSITCKPEVYRKGENTTLVDRINTMLGALPYFMPNNEVLRGDSC